MRLLPALLALAFAAPAAAQTVEDGFKAYDAGDYKTAKAILLPLAEAGDPRAMNLIGRMHELGKGYPKNPQQACDWFEKAAESGYVSAQVNLSLCYEKGTGRPIDVERAISWTEKAAAQGDVECQIDLIRLYHQKNPDKAKEWGQRAANKGSVAARLMLEAYHLGYTGPRPTRLQKYCFIVMVSVMNKPRNYCDF